MSHEPNVRDTRVPDSVDPLLSALEEPRREASGPSFGARLAIAAVILVALALLIWKQSY